MEVWDLGLLRTAYQNGIARPDRLRLFSGGVIGWLGARLGRLVIVIGYSVHVTSRGERSLSRGGEYRQDLWHHVVAKLFKYEAAGRTLRARVRELKQEGRTICGHCGTVLGSH